MNYKDEYVNRVINKFQEYKGKASVYCFHKEFIPEIVYNVIHKFLNRHNDKHILIIVDKYETRKDIIDYIKNKNLCLNNIDCITIDFVNNKYDYKSDLLIAIGINDRENDIIKFIALNKFVLSILTDNIKNSKKTLAIRASLPSIDVSDLHIKITNEKIYSPVEEYRYAVDISDEDRKIYDEYTKFINTTVSIFGSLDTIEKCRVGDGALNISATEFKNSISKENGWREDLDTTIPFMKQIDDLYNPNSLNDRIYNFYNITKLRRDLVLNNNAKLNTIKEICENNKGKRILIISKKGEYANIITNYINDNLNNCCGNYHDCIEDVIAVDEYNKPICIKTGDNKGKIKVIGSQAQSTANERKFNDKIINILSIKSSSNVKLKIACDIVIFTSPFCDNIFDTKKRFANVNFTGTPTITYKIYCNNTIENDKIIKENNTKITIINKTENNILYDEKTNDIIL